MGTAYSLLYTDNGSVVVFQGHTDDGSVVVFQGQWWKCTAVLEQSRCLFLDECLTYIDGYAWAIYVV